MAAEAADVVIMSDNLLRLPDTLYLCRLGRGLILQNCAFTITIKIIAVILAVTGMPIMYIYCCRMRYMSCWLNICICDCV